jgi:hypothetical protein
MGFTIARIIWQVWQHHEAAPLSNAQFARVCRALAALAEGLHGGGVMSADGGQAAINIALR